MAAKKFSDLGPVHQGLILALLPAVLAFIVFYELVAPLRSQAAQLRTQVDTLHSQNMRGRLLEAQRVQLQQKISQAQTELASLEQIVPDQPSDDQFIKLIDAIAVSSSVHLRSLEASPEKRNLYYTEMPFKAHIDGAYYAMADFFARLAAAPRIVNVSDLTLASSQSSGGGTYKLGPQETVAANCVLTTFYNSPPPAVQPGKHGAEAKK
ncbi:MAG: type 4a pilus biogenesis protein PilO [Acidobacteriota bacterium]|nr:type 4a pilus biogenesis protein PilO [Acidobacteriota bacterium]